MEEKNLENAQTPIDAPKNWSLPANGSERVRASNARVRLITEV
jgi:hypothetical protein